jgi:hypothetical protein
LLPFFYLPISSHNKITPLPLHLIPPIKCHIILKLSIYFRRRLWKWWLYLLTNHLADLHFNLHSILIIFLLTIIILRVWWCKQLHIVTRLHHFPLNHIHILFRFIIMDSLFLFNILQLQIFITLFQYTFILENKLLTFIS